MLGSGIAGCKAQTHLKGLSSLPTCKCVALWPMENGAKVDQRTDGLSGMSVYVEYHAISHFLISYTQLDLMNDSSFVSL